LIVLPPQPPDPEPDAQSEPAVQEAAKPQSKVEPAVTKLRAALPAAAPRELSVVVLDIAAPTKVDSGSSLGFKLRTGQSGELDESEFGSLGVEFQRLLVERLKQSLGDKVAARIQDVNLAEGKTEAGTHWVRVAQRTGAKYLLAGSVDEASFDGGFLGGDK